MVYKVCIIYTTNNIAKIGTVMSLTRRRNIVKVFGIVQGVGFRPFIHKLVNNYSLKGWVQNSTTGVTIDIEGEEEDLRKFIDDIPEKAPDLAVIENISVKEGDIKNYNDFKIVKSDCDEEGFVLVSPDVSTCSDCLHDLLDSQNKRYRYPFTNCTNCGPRFTIIKDLPYDRDKTTMAGFKMCTECDREYHDIENRRYHAQPNCCPECGPQLQICRSDGEIIDGDPINIAIEKLKEGNIVAIKGLGGFHLACDAQNNEAVEKLRRRKHRDDKPFAMMCRDLDAVRKYAYVSDPEAKILESIRKPIVLLRKKEGCTIAEGVAPDNNSLGFMLPYTPIHYLIFEDRSISALIMTSANISDNPVIYKNEEALRVLNNIADYFLIHNRDINTRCDDSVVKVVNGREYFMRRSRGYAPFPIKMDFKMKPILACGAEQKASFSLSRDRYIFMSQHIGDLKNYETLEHYEENIENFKRMFRIDPEITVCDLHPDYLSTSYAAEHGKSGRIIRAQHHHAHMTSCMADNNLKGDVIGIIWDGTGYGSDGTIWGGEILTGGYSHFSRRGTFLSTPMPGGDRAVKDIYIMAASYLIGTFGEDFEKYLYLMPGIQKNINNPGLIYKMVSRRINSPLTTSCGRLFDAVSSILGLCSVAGYEGQGAIKLETAADQNINDILHYEIINKDGMYVYDWRCTISDIADLLKCGMGAGYISAAFHNTLVEMAEKVCCLVRDDTGLNRIVLSGGVFQNDIMLHKLMERLKLKGFEVYIHHRISTNDEGISVGQLVIAQNGGGYDVSGSTAENTFGRKAECNSWNGRSNKKNKD